MAKFDLFTFLCPGSPDMRDLIMKCQMCQKRLNDFEHTLEKWKKEEKDKFVSLVVVVVDMLLLSNVTR